MKSYLRFRFYMLLTFLKEILLVVCQVFRRSESTKVWSHVRISETSLRMQNSITIQILKFMR